MGWLIKEKDMSGILDIVETEAEDYGFDYQYDSNRYGASVRVFNAEGELLLFVEQSFVEPTITVWRWDANSDEDTFDKDWDFDLVAELIHESLDRY